MFGVQFYPTPDHLIDRMVESFVGSRWRAFTKSRILEPSAGKGDICDRLVNQYGVACKSISCIEIDPELRIILSGKGYRVLDSDFLEYGEDYWFDLIVMNPPFAAGVDHLLHAWEIMRDGDIVCILNAETVRSPHTEKRRLLLRIIVEHGRCEFVENAFADAERKTGVEIAIVWLTKQTVGVGVDFGAGLEHDATVPDEEFQPNALASRNLIQSLVDQYESAKRALVEEHQARAKVRFYTQGIRRTKDKQSDGASVALSRAMAPVALNEAIDELKKEFWRYIFERTRIGQVTTSEFQAKFNQFSEETHSLAFSVKNIMAILDLFMLNRQNILEECIVSTFDRATAFHEKNMIWMEGWKTNKSYRVARKIIMPRGIEYDGRWINKWSTIYHHRDFYDDLDKVMCFITGQALERVDTIWAAMDERCTVLNRQYQIRNTDLVFLRHDEWFESTFFRIKFFKKGTVHLEFKDEHAWAEFNRRAAAGKNWIGGGY